MAVVIVLFGLLVVGCLAVSLLGDAQRMQPLITGKTLLRAWLPPNTPLHLTPLCGDQDQAIFGIWYHTSVFPFNRCGRSCLAHRPHKRAGSHQEIQGACDSDISAASAPACCASSARSRTRSSHASRHRKMHRRHPRVRQYTRATLLCILDGPDLRTVIVKV
jgi:hypothetical protein